MHILDVVQNSIAAGARQIDVTIDQDEASNRFSFCVEDNGKGMTPEFLAQVRDPFTTTRTTRRVGLGIPLLEQTCEMCGGQLILESTPGKGTLLKAEMQDDNIDRPPLGDIASTMLILLTTTETADFTYVHRHNGAAFRIDTREIKEVLGEDIPLSSPEVMAWIKENLEEGLAEIDII